MQVDFPAPTKRITLQGEWTVSEAVERQVMLVGELESLLEADPGGSRVAIDLNEVTGIDACGCQLLAVFLEDLRSRGIVPEPCNIPPEIRGTIDLLGFAASLAASQATEKDEV